MGFDLLRFVGTVDEEFHCTICTMVLENPLQSPCDHLFCGQCIEEWLTCDRSCPVDRHLLTSDSLKPPARYFQNMLDKLDIKCSFQPQGCDQVIKLEHLESHLINCEYSPSLDIVCDKGCKLAVKRCDYKFDCIVHLANHLRSRDEEICSLTQACNSRNEEVCHLQAQVSKLSRDVISQQKLITKLNSELKRLRPVEDEIQKFPTTQMPLQWQKTFNMNISTNQPNILEFGHNSGSAFAQFSYPLNQTNHFFTTQILNDCGYNSNGIVIGLTQKSHSIDCPPGNSNGSIGYRCCGKLYYDKSESIASHACKISDVIECGIKFSKSFANDGNHSVVVYFAKNGLTFLKKMIRMPVDGLFPTIYMFDFHRLGTVKIKLL